ncbi:MAG TPA: TonB-dependent receptor plug domain-containing protein, partial [bacterium]|nr:TonB-dependent receptor plug domain-containing protein [bacterium]
EEDFFKLEEQLVVTASKRAQKITEAPATIYVITDKEIEQYGFVDLKDVLKLIPGMIVEDLSYGQLYGGQRGFNGVFQKTLIMINGREVNNILANEAFIGPQFPLHNVKRIEVVAGPGSALYGANAFAGVINIITKSAEDINGVDVAYTYGSCKTNLATVNVGKKTDNAELVLSGRLKKSDG